MPHTNSRIQDGLRLSLTFCLLAAVICIPAHPAKKRFDCPKEFDKLIKRIRMQVDVQSYIRDWAEASILKMGFTVPAGLGLTDLLILKQNVESRRIPRKKYNVIVSKEVQDKLANHALDPDIEKGLEQLITKAAAGDDLLPHQSKKLADADYDDKLLNDWGINHLHLGLAMEPAGKWMERTGPIAMVVNRGDNLYIIDVMPHAFTDLEVMKVVHRNWPDLFKDNRYQGRLVHGNPTPEQLAKLRKANLNTPLEMDDGSYYLSTGGGMVMSGANADHVRRADMTLARIRSYKEFIEANKREIAREYLKQGKTPPLDMKLELEQVNYQKGTMTLYDTDLEIHITISFELAP